MSVLFSKTIASLLAPHLPFKVEEIESALEIPPNASMGDVAFPCFKLAALLKKGPPQIAKEIAEKIKPAKEIIRVGANGPYVNFFYDPQQLAQAVMSDKKIPMVPSKPLKNPKTIIEYCQANPMKAFHIGHLRNIILGECICHLFESRGVAVFRMNYGGDVGPHVSKTLYAYQNLWKGKEPTRVEDYGQWLGFLYALGATTVKGNEELEQKMRDMVVQLEQGDPALMSDWKKLRKMSLAYLDLTFKKLGTKFDRFMLESEVEKPGIKLVKELEKKEFAKKSEGALVVDLTSYKLDHFLVLKKDGAALYATKDLALAQYKKKELGMDVSYNLVGSEQSFYFKQLMKTIDLLNESKNGYCKTIHLSYELVVLESGKMSSRDGAVVSFEELFAEVKQKANEETTARRTDWTTEKIDTVADKLAMAAIKFSMLLTETNRKITFNREKATSLEGETGPYLLYSYARSKSILRKATTGKVKPELLVHEKEQALLKVISHYSLAVDDSWRNRSPHTLCQYLLLLSSTFNSFYQDVSVLNAENDELKSARLALVENYANVLQKGLGLLGIETLEEM